MQLICWIWPIAGFSMLRINWHSLHVQASRTVYFIGHCSHAHWLCPLYICICIIAVQDHELSAHAYKWPSTCVCAGKGCQQHVSRLQKQDTWSICSIEISSYFHWWQIISHSGTCTHTHVKWNCVHLICQPILIDCIIWIVTEHLHMSCIYLHLASHPPARVVRWWAGLQTPRWSRWPPGRETADWCLRWVPCRAAARCRCAPQSSQRSWQWWCSPAPL